MSLASRVNNPALDELVQSSLESECRELKWIPYSEVIDIRSSPIDNVCYARTSYDSKIILLVLLGNDETCTPTFVCEFAKVYSLPTHEYNNDDSQFRRYKKWLENRNKLIKGFTKYDDNYYMVAYERFHHYYSRYGFCSECGRLRCGPVWCICGRKELSDGWSSNNKKLDEFIKSSQIQANSANDAYLEWIPFDCIEIRRYIHRRYLGSLPTAISCEVKLIPLEITDETDDDYYVKVNYSANTNEY